MITSTSDWLGGVLHVCGLHIQVSLEYGESHPDEHIISRHCAGSIDRTVEIVIAAVIKTYCDHSYQVCVR